MQPPPRLRKAFVIVCRWLRISPGLWLWRKGWIRLIKPCRSFRLWLCLKWRLFQVPGVPLRQGLSDRLALIVVWRCAGVWTWRSRSVDLFFGYRQFADQWIEVVKIAVNGGAACLSLDKDSGRRFISVVAVRNITVYLKVNRLNHLKAWHFRSALFFNTSFKT